MMLVYLRKLETHERSPGNGTDIIFSFGSDVKWLSKVCEELWSALPHVHKYYQTKLMCINIPRVGLVANSNPFILLFSLCRSNIPTALWQNSDFYI